MQQYAKVCKVCKTLQEYSKVCNNIQIYKIVKNSDTFWDKKKNLQKYEKYTPVYKTVQIGQKWKETNGKSMQKYAQKIKIFF